MNVVRFALASVILSMAFGGCSKPGAGPQSAAPAATPENIAAAPVAPPPPSHIWEYREGQEYGYAGALSEDDQKAGRAVAPVHMFRYIGEANGVYTVADASDGMMTVASCSNPCQVVKIFGGGSMERVTFNPESLVGAALTDAFNGQMEIYGSALATSAQPVPVAPEPPPPPVSPAPQTAPVEASDPYAADRAAERDADGGGPPKIRAGTTRYACAFAPELSAAPLPHLGSLSYVVDESRFCINGRTAYARTKGNGLARVMLSDRDQRVSVVSVSPDRRTFTRQDFILSPSQYSSARVGGRDLISITCPSTSSADDVSNDQARLAAAHRAMRSALSGLAVSRRMVWHCAPLEGDGASG